MRVRLWLNILYVIATTKVERSATRPLKSLGYNIFGDEGHGNVRENRRVRLCQ